MVPSGTYTFGPNNGRLLVHVDREGMAKKMGHDLIIELAQWNADVTVDVDNPGQSQMTMTADSRSMEVVEGHGGVKSLSDGDKRDIKKNIDDKVLKGGSNISFRSRSITPNGSGATVSGDLTINGATQPANFTITVDGSKARGRTTIVQSQFGIKPFSAFMGALKVKDAVDVEFEANLPQ